MRYNYQLAELNWLSILVILPIGSNSNFIIIYNCNYRLVREISSGMGKGRQAWHLGITRVEISRTARCGHLDGLQFEGMPIRKAVHKSELFENGIKLNQGSTHTYSRHFA